jgi:hypothetical protein
MLEVINTISKEITLELGGYLHVSIDLNALADTHNAITFQS